MSGNIIVSVLEKTRLEYSYLAAGASQTIILRPALNVVDYNWVQLIVRVHARDMVASSSIRLSLVNTLPSPDDPREFSETSDFLFVDVTSTSPGSVPGLVEEVGSNPQAYLKLVATASQPAGSSGNLYADLSAVLLLRKN